jgi:hypothetical protein
MLKLMRVRLRKGKMITIELIEYRTAGYFA